jgi:hypothetical protein
LPEGHLPTDTFARKKKTFTPMLDNLSRANNLRENVFEASVFRANALRANDIEPSSYNSYIKLAIILPNQLDIANLA